MEDEDQLACHELLLRLAGRLPDDDLWRYRDWLAAGAMGVLARTLPKALLRFDIDLDPNDHQLLRTALLPHGADPHLVSSALGVDDTPEGRYTFTEAAPDRWNVVDSVSAVVDAALRGRPEVGEVRESWRYSHLGGERDAKRVLLVTAISGWSRLTGELQRVVRVLGDEVPSIEVLPPRVDLPAYHLAALARSRTVSVGAVDAGHHGGAA
ncbi:MAG: hypothetical protein ACRDQB_02755 [Thermocrispum sp.]